MSTKKDSLGQLPGLTFCFTTSLASSSSASLSGGKGTVQCFLTNFKLRKGIANTILAHDNLNWKVQDNG